jgi:cell wall assembly regulator SMI1/nucleoid DNA-binding protein
MSWERIRRWEAEHLPKVPKRPRGASARALAAARAAIPGLPEDYLARMAEQNGTDSPVFEGWTVDRVDALPEQWRGLQSWLPEPGDPGRYDAVGPVRPVYLHPRWIPFAWDGAGNHLCLDLAPAAGGAEGQVVEFVHDDGKRQVLAPSFTAWLTGIADRLEQGALEWSPAFARVVAAAPKVGSRDTLEAVAEALLTALAEAEDGAMFALPGLGVVKVKVRRGFSGTNPKSGEPLVAPASRTAGFGSTGELGRRLNPGFEPQDAEPPFADPPGVRRTGWIGRAGLDPAAVQAALAPLVAAVDGRTKALELPGLGRLEAQAFYRGRRALVLRLSDAARAALRGE